MKYLRFWGKVLHGFSSSFSRNSDLPTYDIRKCIVLKYCKRPAFFVITTHNPIIFQIFRPDNFVFGQSGAGNNWAKGHYTEGKKSFLFGTIVEWQTRPRRRPSGCQKFPFPRDGIILSHAIFSPNLVIVYDRKESLNRKSFDEFFHYLQACWKNATNPDGVNQFFFF